MVFSADMDDDYDDNQPAAKRRKSSKCLTPSGKPVKTRSSVPVTPSPGKQMGPTALESVQQLLEKWMARGKVGVCQHKHCHRGLLVGSACSGWCSELIALKRMGIQHTCCFASDNDPHVRALATKTHPHCRWFNDVTDDEFLQAPMCDLFFAGFPCQPFSMAGKSMGMDEDRGIVVLFLLRYIAQAKPRAFLLENVEGLLRNHKGTLTLILEVLVALVDSEGRQL